VNTKEPDRFSSRLSDGSSLHQYALTDAGNGERFAARSRNHATFDTSRKGWRVWDGTRYRLDETGAVFQLAKETARSIRQEAVDQPTDKAKKTCDWAFASESNNRLNAMLSAART